jgi:hypothetical protein
VPGGIASKNTQQDEVQMFKYIQQHLTFVSFLAVYAIQLAGLAIGIGIGSSFIVLVSFVWGIFVFQEPVHSRAGASMAILCMMLGLLGMSYFSSPESVDFESAVGAIEDNLELEATHSDLNNENEIQRDNPVVSKTRIRQRADPILYQNLSVSLDDHESSSIPKVCLPDTASSNVDHCHSHEVDGIVLNVHHEPEVMVVLGRKMSRRHVGMMSAVFTGCYGGSLMAPMQYSPSNAKGTHFLISFAVGSAIVNVALWVLRYLYHWHETKCAFAAFAKLPSFHFREMWKPGMVCGLLCTFHKTR